MKTNVDSPYIGLMTDLGSNQALMYGLPRRQSRPLRRISGEGVYRRIANNVFNFRKFSGTTDSTDLTDSFSPFQCFNVSITQISGERLRSFRVPFCKLVCQHLRSVLHGICVIAAWNHHVEDGLHLFNLCNPWFFEQPKLK